MELCNKKDYKKTISLRLLIEDDAELEKIKNKYGFTKSSIVENLIKKYAKEEYGAY